MADTASVRLAFAALPAKVDTEAIRQLDKVVVQFELTGEGGVTYHAIVENGACQVSEGEHASPDRTFTIAADEYSNLTELLNDYLALISGRGKVIVGRGKVISGGGKIEWITPPAHEPVPCAVPDEECTVVGTDEAAMVQGPDTHGPGKGRPGSESV